MVCSRAVTMTAWVASAGSDLDWAQASAASAAIASADANGPGSGVGAWATAISGETAKPIAAVAAIARIAMATNVFLFIPKSP
jgi:hypothetical protein